MVSLRDKKFFVIETVILKNIILAALVLHAHDFVFVDLRKTLTLRDIPFEVKFATAATFLSEVLGLRSRDCRDMLVLGLKG